MENSRFGTTFSVGLFGIGFYNIIAEFLGTTPSVIAGLICIAIGLLFMIACDE